MNILCVSERAWQNYRNKQFNLSPCAFCVQTNTLRPELLSFHNSFCFDISLPNSPPTLFLSHVGHFSLLRDSLVDVGKRRIQRTKKQKSARVTGRLHGWFKLWKVRWWWVTGRSSLQKVTISHAFIHLFKMLFKKKTSGQNPPEGVNNFDCFREVFSGIF